MVEINMKEKDALNFLKDLHSLITSVIFLCTLSQENVDLLNNNFDRTLLENTLLNFDNKINNKLNKAFIPLCTIKILIVHNGIKACSGNYFKFKW